MAGSHSDPVGGPATDNMRRAFGAALDAAMHNAQLAPRDIAQKINLTDDAIRKWISGKGEPKPLTTFVVEEILAVAPGELSRHLGYIPAGATVSVAAALEADTALTPEARRLILATYRAGRRG